MIINFTKEIWTTHQYSPYGPQHSKRIHLIHSPPLTSHMEHSPENIHYPWSSGHVANCATLLKLLYSFCHVAHTQLYCCCSLPHISTFYLHKPSILLIFPTTQARQCCRSKSQPYHICMHPSLHQKDPPYPPYFLSRLAIIATALFDPFITKCWPITHLIPHNPSAIAACDSSLTAAGGWFTDMQFWWYLKWPQTIQLCTLQAGPLATPLSASSHWNMQPFW